MNTAIDYQSIEKECVRIAEKLLSGTEGDQKGDLTRICAAKQLIGAADTARRLAREEEISKSYGADSPWIIRNCRNEEEPFNERN